MSLVLDLILVAIVLLCGWRGFRTGIINGICGIIVVIVALYGANLVATAYSAEFTGMLRPFAIGIVESATNDAIGIDMASPENADGAENVTINTELTGTLDYDSLDVYDTAMKVLGNLGIAGDAAEGLARETADSCDRVGSEMSSTITDLVCVRTCYMILFTIVLLLIAIIFSVIANIFDLAFGIPGHENLNHITGAALGVVQGVMIILIIGCLFRYLGLFLSENTISDTRILSRLVESNKLATILGI